MGYPDESQYTDRMLQPAENGTASGGPDKKRRIDNPGRVLAAVALAGAVLGLGLYAGFELRRFRLGRWRNPYRAYEKEKVRDTETGEDYGAVGI